MTPPALPADQNEFVHGAKLPTSPWKRILGMFRWTTYTLALVLLVLLLHQAPPSLVEASYK